MAETYQLGREATQQLAEMYRWWAVRPRNERLPEPRGPRGNGSPPLRHYRLTGASYIHRGSHPNGVTADEVAVAGLNGGRVTWTTIRSGITLYCGSNGVYLQRDAGSIGNDPREPDGGDDDEDPPCPPNCTFTGNSQVIYAGSESPPAWWFQGADAPSSQQASGAAGASVFAVTGQRIKGIDFTVGQWETQFVGVVQDDLTTQTYGDVSIDGLITVSAYRFCSEGLSSGTLVDVRYRELGGLGGFVIIDRICCPGFTL